MKVHGMRGAVAALTLALLAPSARAGEVPGSASPGGGDPRVRGALDEAGLRYVVDDNQDFQLLFELGDGRSQVVWINSATQAVTPFEVREVWSGAYLARRSLPRRVANALLVDSYHQKVGAWASWPDRSGRNMAIFVVKIDADAPADALATAVQAVLVVADTMERHLGGKDRF